MAQIKAFRGIRYNPSRVNPADEICPPYDVISESQREELRGKSSSNFVRVELPSGYADAGKNLRRWLKEGTLMQDEKPAVYVYQQEFALQGKKFLRSGFFCVLRLPDTDAGRGTRRGTRRGGRVLKHEKVSDTPIRDRIALAKETGSNTSPVFCLVEDDSGALGRLLKVASRRKPEVSFRDSEGTLHRYWVKNDSRFVESLVKLMSPREPFIADGHHRFTMASRLRDELRAGGASDYVLVYVVPADDAGIVVLPTYRVVRRLPELEKRIKANFRIKEYDGKKIPCLVMYSDGRFSQLVPAASAARGGAQAKELPVITLHRLLLDGLYGKDEIYYTKSITDAVEQAQKTHGIAFLLDKPDMKRIFRLSRKGEIMPHKTTYFYPKVPAGIVIHRFME